MLEIETYFTYFCEHASTIGPYFFCLLILAGINIPISEDILLLTAGIIASTCLPPDQKWALYPWMLAGSWMSAWEMYGIGRFLGPKVQTWRFFRKIVTIERVDYLRKAFHKFGVFVFIVGRFIPGGFRNALFFSAGLTKMPFFLFIFRDGIGCLLVTFLLYSVGYTFAEHADVLFSFLKKYQLIGGLFVLSVAFLCFLYYFFYKKKLK